jgi:hypothetical protein
MRNDKNIPAGLFALTLPLIYTGVRSIFDLMVIMVQSHEAVESGAGQAVPMILLVNACFCLILAAGMILLYRTAFIIYVIYYGCHIFQYLIMTAISGQDIGIQLSRTAVIYLIAILGALYYRPYFFEQDNHNP